MDLAANAKSPVVPWREWLVALLVMGVGATILYVTSPSDGDFAWSDAPRNALNGAFLFDFLRELPIGHPIRWAYDYYLQYPALSILFYPPLFYVLLVPFYALFGVSQASALVLGAIFNVMLGLSTYALARRLVAPLTAIGVGLATMAAPEMAFWSRMVMLDVPAIALMTWSIVVFLRFCDRGRTLDLAAFLFLFVCALYTKQFMAFVSPALAVYLVWSRGMGFFVERRTWVLGAITALSLVPLVLLNLRFAAFNFEQAGASALALKGGLQAILVYYLRELPDQVTWPALGLGVLGFVLLVFGRLERRHLPVFLLLLAWILLCYAMFTPIASRSPRFTLPFVGPWMIFAGLALEHILRRPGQYLAGAGAVVLLGYTLLVRPVESFTGMKDAAMAAARFAPPNSNIYFSGKYDGAFIFALRAYSGRSDLSTIRADKTLLRVRVARAFGLEQSALDDQEILDLISKLGLRIIVHHEGFWTDVPVIARFEKLLKTSAFTELQVIPLVSNFPTTDATRIRIYKPNFAVAEGRPTIPMELGHTGDIVQ